MAHRQGEDEGAYPLIRMTCCISLGQHYPFGVSTEAPRQCLGAPDLLEHRKIGWGSPTKTSLGSPGT